MVSAWKYFTIGDKYLIPKIQEAAKEYTSSVSLTDTTFWELIENNIFSSPIFLDKVNSYLMENKNNLIQSEKFLKVPESIVECVVQMDKLNVQEYQLLLAVSKWAYHNKSRITSKILAKYYKHIRFSTLLNNEFFQFIDSYPKAIDAESVVEILRHLHSPSRCSLPKWCSTSKVLRIKEFQNHQGKIRGYCGSGYNYHPY